LSSSDTIVAMAEFDLRHATAAVHARSDEWENAGVRWSLTVGSERDGSVASLTCEIDQVSVRLIIRADGDAEINVFSQPAKPSSLYYYRLATAADVAACLNELTRLIIPSR
jgi:hypothetical protein